MSIRTIAGPVSSPAHGDNLLHPRFPRVASGVPGVEDRLAQLYRSGFRVTIGDLTVLLSEPRALVERHIAWGAYDTQSSSYRVPSRRTPRPSGERARVLRDRQPMHGLCATVTVTTPGKQRLSFRLGRITSPAPWERTSRSRLVPMDLLAFTLHTLESWEEDLGEDDPHQRVGAAVRDAST